MDFKEESICKAYFSILPKNFDDVHHETLLQQLDSCRVHGLSLKCLYSYLRDRDQSMQVANYISSKAKITNRVPQGQHFYWFL